MIGFDRGTPRANRGDEGRAGVTLVELLVAIAVTSILVLALLQVIRRTTQTVRTNQARTTLMTNLTATGQRIANDLRGRGREASGSVVGYKLIGRNGDGSDGFVNDLEDTGRPLNVPRDGDHFHLHPKNYPNDPELSFEHLCFFLNNGDHPDLDDEDGDGNDEWGLIRRHGEVGSPGNRWDDNRIAPLDYTEAAPVGSNIDYLSFRYYDRDDDQWSNTWDSGNTGEYPDAIEFALRAYDPHGRVEPRWYVSTVSFSRTGN